MTQIINHKTLQLIFFLLGFVFSNQSLFAQKSDTGDWLIYFGNQKISKRWNWWNEIQYRNYNAVGDLQQLLLRTGIGYNLTESNNNILLGYGFAHSRQYLPGSDKETSSTNEHRIYEQFTTRQSFGRVFIQHRYRIEERFLTDDFRVRFRYFLSFNIALNNKTLTDKTWYASAYNEVFLNAKNPVFDRNRLYGGLGYVINKNFRIETGFMTQMLQSNKRNQVNIMFYNNLPLTKKQ